VSRARRLLRAGNRVGTQPWQSKWRSFGDGPRAPWQAEPQPRLEMRLRAGRHGTTLMTEMHRNPQRTWTPNDVFDIQALSVGVAYCDAVLCDKDKARMLNLRKVGDRLGTRITSRLAELPDVLA
jgi:hypothetical protein